MAFDWTSAKEQQFSADLPPPRGAALAVRTRDNDYCPAPVGAALVAARAHVHAGITRLDAGEEQLRSCTEVETLSEHRQNRVVKWAAAARGGALPCLRLSALPEIKRPSSLDQ